MYSLSCFLLNGSWGSFFLREEDDPLPIFGYDLGILLFFFFEICWVFIMRPFCVLMVVLFYFVHVDGCNGRYMFQDIVSSIHTLTGLLLLPCLLA